jgi:hypothetical protein
MTDEPWDRIREILDRALDRPPGERADWLDAVCEDPQIRAEVESLLAAYEEDDPFFETGGAREGARPEAPDRPAAGARIGPRPGPGSATTACSRKSGSGG